MSSMALLLVPLSSRPSHRGSETEKFEGTTSSRDQIMTRRLVRSWTLNNVRVPRQVSRKSQASGFRITSCCGCAVRSKRDVFFSRQGCQPNDGEAKVRGISMMMMILKCIRQQCVSRGKSRCRKTWFPRTPRLSAREKKKEVGA